MEAKEGCKVGSLAEPRQSPSGHRRGGWGCTGPQALQLWRGVRSPPAARTPARSVRVGRQDGLVSPCRGTQRTAASGGSLDPGWGSRPAPRRLRARIPGRQGGRQR